MQIYREVCNTIDGKTKAKAFYINGVGNRVILYMNEDVLLVDAFIAGMITYHHEVIQTPLPPVIECGNGYIPLYRHYEVAPVVMKSLYNYGN